MATITKPAKIRPQNPIKQDLAARVDKHEILRWRIHRIANKINRKIAAGFDNLLKTGCN